ncbi:hypothetical protein HK100_000631 [Physocladia obscura]|uniref:Rap-GAP domain-containing protein n=1 Tax=Physocladia obscura TaxID=109957 RepID=A0AAD5SY01_9FUNG|nr:hypothetical protein HK100_000631 [Physocladia obscura]
MSEAFFKDLERMDTLPERECFGVSVLYAGDCQSTMEDLLCPKSISTDFFEFLQSVGQSVELKDHVGYHGVLNPSNCNTVPYFASRNVEILFNTPYIMKEQSLEGKDSDKLPIASEILFKQRKELFLASTYENHATVIWVENLIAVENLVKYVVSEVAPSTTVAIIIHPHSSISGMYNIRLLNSLGIIEDNLSIGPLNDGMCISKIALGVLTTDCQKAYD